METGTRGELDDFVFRAMVYILSMEADRYPPQTIDLIFQTFRKLQSQVGRIHQQTIQLPLHH